MSTKLPSIATTFSCSNRSSVFRLVKVVGSFSSSPWLSEIPRHRKTRSRDAFPSLTSWAMEPTKKWKWCGLDSEEYNSTYILFMCFGILATLDFGNKKNDVPYLTCKNVVDSLL